MTQYLEQAGKLHCIFTGSLSTVVCQELQTEVTAKVEAAKLPVVFDMKDVDFVGSMFLRICMMVNRIVGAKNLSIVNLRPLVKKVFKIAGFDENLTLE